jgi:1-deoxy-D-xylulose-5-phosphate reductoisomerase
MRTIAILGATGSIGTQALDIVRRHPDQFRAGCLTAHGSSDRLFELVREFRPDVAALVDEPEVIPDDLRFCQWVFGPDSTVRALKASGAQDALCAIVGIAGLDAVWTALDVCQRILLANKEALVTGGDLVASLVKRHCGIKDFGTIFPGHGGMMDRMDGILFCGVACYVFFKIYGL